MADTTTIPRRRKQQDEGLRAKKKRNCNSAAEAPSSCVIPWHNIVQIITNDEDELLTLQKKVSLLRTISLVERRASQDVAVFGWVALAHAIERECRIIRLSAPVIERGDFGILSDSVMKNFYRMVFEQDRPHESMEAIRTEFVHKVREPHPNRSFLLRLRMMSVLNRSFTVPKRQAATDYLLTREDLAKYNVRGTRGRLVHWDVKDACFDKFGSNAGLRTALSAVERKKERLAQAKRQRAERFAEVRTMCIRASNRAIQEAAERISSSQYAANNNRHAIERAEMSETIARVFRSCIDSSDWYDTMIYAQIITCREGGSKTVQNFVKTGRPIHRERLEALATTWRDQCSDRLQEAVSAAAGDRLPPVLRWDWSQAAMDYALKASLTSRERICAIESVWEQSRHF